MLGGHPVAALERQGGLLPVLGRGDIPTQAAVSQVTLSHAIRAFQVQGILVESERGLDQGKLRFSTGTSELDLERVQERLRFLLRRTRATPR